MGRDIQLDGAEITILKAIGVGASEVDGQTLIDRCENLDIEELMDTLKGLMQQGYVDGDSIAFYSEEEMVKLNFHVSSGWVKDLKDALDPDDKPEKSKRVRRE